MKQIWCVILLCLPLAARLTAQINVFDVTGVPDSLKKKASVIKRSEEITLEVSDVELATLNVHQVLTVMNEHGKRALLFHQYSSRTYALADADIRVYDANGKQIGKYRKKDMTTVPTGEGLIDDGYMIYFSVTTPAYPVTVEYTYTHKLKGTLWLPTYTINLPEQSVQSSVFIVKMPKDLDLRYTGKNIRLEPQITEEDKYKLYKWSVSNMPPAEYEEGCSQQSSHPYIILAPTRFSFYGHEGDLSTWKNYGQWMANLYTGLDVLPEERKAFFRDLVKSAANDREKARLIYDYLQKNFRYVSIQLGLGGFRPFSADFTDKKKYGDCKALSNFTKAALDAVGIRSYVAIINAEYNSEPVSADFPCDNSLNHVILCIPQSKDSIWLECTSSVTDFGILGNFTENRYALLVTENGGALVRTPDSKSSDNIFSSTTIISLNDDGSGQAISSFNTTGEFKQLFYHVMNEKDDDKKQFLVNELGCKQPDAFSMQKKEQGLHLGISLDMNIEKIPAFMAGSKMFLSPRIYKLWLKGLPKAENRKKDYYFENPFERVDTTIFKLPAGYIAEALPSAKMLDCPYGKYITKYWFNETEHSVYCATQFLLAQYRIPATGYAAVKKFFDDVMLDEAQRIVIKKG